jgi:urea transporter
MITINFIEFIDSIFKGIGQVQFHDSAITGVLFLVGLAIYSRRLALWGFIGSLVATLVGIAIGGNNWWVTFGLFGFNGELTATALWLFIKPSKRSVVYTLFGTALSAVVMVFLTRFFVPWGLPALTGPFNITTMLLLWAVGAGGVLHGFGKLNVGDFGWWMPWPTMEEKWTAAECVKTAFRGMSQVMFSDHWLTGIVFFIGLTLGGYFLYPWNYSHIPGGTTNVGFPFGLGGVVALMGSVIGTLTAIGLRADKQAVHHGIFGYNGVLTALALFGVFYTLNPINLVYAIFFTIVSTLIMAAIMSIYAPYKMPALTLPFCVTTWIAIYATQIFTGVFV